MQDLKIFKNLFNVEDKIALVTGGGTGIGKIISEVLALAGSKVYITSRKLDIIKKTAEEINLKKPKHPPLKPFVVAVEAPIKGNYLVIFVFTISFGSSGSSFFCLNVANLLCK